MNFLKQIIVLFLIIKEIEFLFFWELVSKFEQFLIKILSNFPDQAN